MKRFTLFVATLLLLTACHKESLIPEPQPSPQPTDSIPTLPENFPEETSWSASQTIILDDTLEIPVTWGLDFWDSYYQAWNGQINYCGDSVCCGKTLIWQYDTTLRTGTVAIDGKRCPFSYDPSTQVLTLEYRTTIHGKNIPIGGTLRFHPKQQTK